MKKCLQDKEKMLETKRKDTCKKMKETHARKGKKHMQEKVRKTCKKRKETPARKR